MTDEEADFVDLVHSMRAEMSERDWELAVARFGLREAPSMSTEAVAAAFHQSDETLKEVMQLEMRVANRWRETRYGGR
ncbi:MAG: hypothetical protein HKN91_04905 [Acidimicrobiia bacterium]|nr:hypothetical protein [Acidimicrobiia bacterium]